MAFNILGRAGWYCDNIVIFFGDDNHIVKIFVKWYYHDIDIIAVVTEKLPDFIVYKLKMAPQMHLMASVVAS